MAGLTTWILRGVGRARWRRHGITLLIAGCSVASGWALSGAARAATAPTPTKTAPKTATAKSTAATSSKPAAGAKTTSTRRTTSASLRPLGDIARDARELEDAGAYSQAAEKQRELRRRLPLDGDLELALALNEARIGAVDSALARLSGPTLTAAQYDSLPVRRRHEYVYGRDLAWGNGHYDGWHWYVWRARAELLAERGRWSEACDAARQCTVARPLSGKEWLILAVCAGRAGRDQEARAAAEQAVDFDPTLPEAHYVLGLWEWRQGRRAAALGRFREAVALDSTYASAALATIRSRVPGVAPDSLPTALLNGVRRVGLLTSVSRPKPEEFEQMDITATLLTSPDSAVVDSLIPGKKPVQVTVSVLVDEQGRVVLNEIPWFSPAAIDYRKITRILRGTPGWVFNPAQRFGRPRRVWVGVDFYLNP